MTLVCLSCISMLLLSLTLARPPTAEEELKEQEMSDVKGDYDTLPAYAYFPESIREVLKKEKMRYLELLQQQSL